MIHWRLLGKTFCYWPAKPTGIIEIIGGSYISFKPHISYKRLLDSLAARNFALHVWSYLPNFDHQFQANQAWKDLRLCKKKLIERVGETPNSFRLGHSLGCKLHLLSPDKGRNCEGLISLSFNNFTAKKSVPLLGKITSKMNIQKEFKPSPKETIALISEQYKQPNNLLIGFSDDNLDQSNQLLITLRERSIDKSIKVILRGNHLTPVSTGFSSKFLKDFSEVSTRSEDIDKVINTICTWTCI